MSRECLAKHPRVISQLCDLNYPYRCGTSCMNQYKKWLKTEPEVQQLEKEAEENSPTG